MKGPRTINMSHPIGCRHYFNEDAAATFREPPRVHAAVCQPGDQGDGHQYQRLYFTASGRWALLCVHPFGGTRTHARYVSRIAAEGWLERNGYDPRDAGSYARELQRRRRATQRGDVQAVAPRQPPTSAHQGDDDEDQSTGRA